MLWDRFLKVDLYLQDFFNFQIRFIKISDFYTKKTTKFDIQLWIVIFRDDSITQKWYNNKKYLTNKKARTKQNDKQFLITIWKLTCERDMAVTRAVCASSIVSNGAFFPRPRRTHVHFQTTLCFHTFSINPLFGALFALRFSSRRPFPAGGLLPRHLPET